MAWVPSVFVFEFGAEISRGDDTSPQLKQTNKHQLETVQEFTRSFKVICTFYWPGFLNDHFICKSHLGSFFKTTKLNLSQLVVTLKKNTQIIS